jgi:hypothetical protein
MKDSYVLAVFSIMAASLVAVLAMAALSSGDSSGEAGCRSSCDAAHHAFVSYARCANGSSSCECTP